MPETTITVTGTYTTAATGAVGGSVMFTPSTIVYDSVGQIVVASTPIVATVSSSTGMFSQELVCTDGANLRPAGWFYNVTVSVAGAAQTFTTYLPDTGATVDITDLIPLPEITSISNTQQYAPLPLQGVVTLTSGSATVLTSQVSNGSVIFLTSQFDGGTPGSLRVSSRQAGQSFTISSSSLLDTSVVGYQVFQQGN